MIKEKDHTISQKDQVIRENEKKIADLERQINEQFLTLKSNEHVIDQNEKLKNDFKKGYLKEKGFGAVRGFFQFGHKTRFMHDTKRLIIALSKKEKGLKLSAGEEVLLKDKNLLRAANAYSQGFQLWAKLLKEAGVEGAEDLAANTGRFYVPRKISFESFAALERRIGEDGIEDLLTNAIASSLSM